MIQMVVKGVQVNQQTNQHYVLLREARGERNVRIPVERYEAYMVAASFQGGLLSKLFAYNVFISILKELGAVVVRCTIRHGAENKLLARLILNRGNQELEFEAEAPDAIALSLCANASIFIEENMLI